MNDQPTKWVPTKEELALLGFKWNNPHYSLDTDSAVLFYYPRRINNGFLFGLIADIYPKSLEELKALITIMNP